MSRSKYRYNPKTCRYEPARTSIVSIVGLAILFCITTTLISGGLLFLHSKLFLTENGKALKRENTTLTKHQTSLERGLSSVSSVLTDLNSQNSNLYKKIFETPINETSNATATENSSLLLADASGFHSEVLELKDRILGVSKTSIDHNTHFSTLTVEEKELKFLMTIPSIQPVENSELTKLASGFGKRINPFHKGNYHHPGADFAAPRGTAVLATAKGVVTDVKNSSSLQAGYGNYVEIDHGNGIITLYAHLENASVRVGKRVSKGEIIGEVGMSGGAVAPHVHYEVIRKGKKVDPIPYLMENLNSTDYITLQKLGSKKNQALD
jgi:murein DD-endopeptidase MepM/ murein hydrolase activator NlpD